MTLALTPLAIALVLTTATIAASAPSRTTKRLIKKTPRALCPQSEKQQAWRDRVGDLARCAMGRPAHLASWRGPAHGRRARRCVHSPHEPRQHEGRRHSARDRGG